MSKAPSLPSPTYMLKLLVLLLIDNAFVLMLTMFLLKLLVLVLIDNAFVLMLSTFLLMLKLASLLFWPWPGPSARVLPWPVLQGPWAGASWAGSSSGSEHPDVVRPGFPVKNDVD